MPIPITASWNICEFPQHVTFAYRTRGEFNFRCAKCGVCKLACTTSRSARNAAFTTTHSQRLTSSTPIAADSPPTTQPARLASRHQRQRPRAQMLQMRTRTPTMMNASAWNSTRQGASVRPYTGEATAPKKIRLRHPTVRRRPACSCSPRLCAQHQAIQIKSLHNESGERTAVGRREDSGTLQ